MDLRPYIESIHSQLITTAEAGGEEARALADRLAAPLESAVRLALQDVLAAAAEEITVELAPGSVELRLRGRDPEFVVTPVPSGSEETTGRGSAGDGEDWGPIMTREGDEGGTARINLRLPEHLKARVDAAAATEALSINTWLVRVIARAVERDDPGKLRARRAASGGQRVTGWAR